MKDIPAFPLNELDQITGQIHAQHFGMTLRDYFAAKASEEDIGFWRPTGRMAITANSITGRPLEVPELRTREQARYAFADAMLKAREA